VQLYTTAVARFYAFLVRERHRTDLQLETMHLRLAALRGKRPKRLPKCRRTSDRPDDPRSPGRARPARPSTRSGSGLRNIAGAGDPQGSGVRVSELVSLRRGDLDHEQRRAVVTGKGGKQRLVFFTDEAWRAIWTTSRRARRRRGRPRCRVRAPRRAARPRRRRPNAGAHDQERARDRVGAGAGSPARGPRITPHRFRAWFATHLVAETGDLAAAQDLLGHESADTTRVYTKVASQRLAEAHRRAFSA